MTNLKDLWKFDICQDHCVKSLCQGHSATMTVWQQIWETHSFGGVCDLNEAELPLDYLWENRPLSNSGRSWVVSLSVIEQIVAESGAQQVCGELAKTPHVWRYYFSINYRNMHYNNRRWWWKWWAYDFWGCAVDAQPKNQQLCSEGQKTGSSQRTGISWNQNCGLKGQKWKEMEKRKGEKLSNALSIKSCNVYFIQAHYLLNTAQRIHWPVFLVA